MSELLEPGRVLGGRYRLVHEIARGGMGTVWEADDPLLARHVAVKTLDPVIGRDETVRARFRREAVTAAAVTHQNIVSTYDTGEDDGVAYIVMELVAGITLRQLIDRDGALPVTTAADIAYQVADALAVAHARGLVHRDVKPGNVLVQPDGRVKVTDFGIAKAADSGGEELTRTGMVVGTARYLAPEQVDGRVVDERVDIYSLGLVLYEMLCGRAPFEADTDIATAVARLTAPPKPDPPRVPGRAGRPRGRHRPRAREGSGRSVAERAGVSRRARAVPYGRATRAGRSDHPRPPPAAPERRRPGREHGPRPGRGRCTGRDAAAGHPAAPGAVDLRLRHRCPGRVPRLPGCGRPAGVERGLAPDPRRSTPADREHPRLRPRGRPEPRTPIEVALAIDGNAATFWSTESYQDRDVGGLKPGVGLAVDLGSPKLVDRVEVDTPDHDWSAQVYTSDSVPDTIAGWGTPLFLGAGLGTNAQLALQPPTRARNVLLWITDLPPERPYRLRVAEVRVVGSP